MLEGLQVLGRALPGVEARLVAGGAVADQLDVLLGLGQLALDVVGRRTRVDDLGLEGSDLTTRRVDRRELGQVRFGVRDLVETRVDGLQV